MAVLSHDAVARHLATLSGWGESGGWLRKVYEFSSYDDVIAFVNRVAALAQAQDHHPDMLVRYASVTLTLQSHDAGGLTLRDFRLAEAIDG